MQTLRLHRQNSLCCRDLLVARRNTLRCAYIEDCTNVCLFSLLSKCSQLEKLTVLRANMVNYQVPCVPLWPNLTKLHLGLCDKYIVDHIMKLLACKYLQYLELTLVHVNPTGIPFASMRHLRDLSLIDCNISDVQFMHDVVTHCNQLESLHLGMNSIGDKSTVTFYLTLPQLPRLREFSLFRNHVRKYMLLSACFIRMRPGMLVVLDDESVMKRVRVAWRERALLAFMSAGEGYAPADVFRRADGDLRIMSRIASHF